MMIKLTEAAEFSVWLGAAESSAGSITGGSVNPGTDAIAAGADQPDGAISDLIGDIDQRFFTQFACGVKRSADERNKSSGDNAGSEGKKKTRADPRRTRAICKAEPAAGVSSSSTHN